MVPDFCHPGYAVPGATDVPKPFSLTCILGRWIEDPSPYLSCPTCLPTEARLPSCVKVDCQATANSSLSVTGVVPDNFTNNFISNECLGGIQFGETCDIRCRPGFLHVFSNLPTATYRCTAEQQFGSIRPPGHGTVSPISPESDAGCAPLRCPPMVDPFMDNTTSSCEGGPEDSARALEFEQTCRVQCLPGYVNGANPEKDYFLRLYTCNASQLLQAVEANTVQCQPQRCAALGSVRDPIKFDDGISKLCNPSTSNAAAGTVCNFTCNEGFVLEQPDGSEKRQLTLTCASRGPALSAREGWRMSWTNQLYLTAFCKPESCDTSVVEIFHIYNNPCGVIPDEGDCADAVCSPGYRRQGYFLCKRGKLVSTPTCEPSEDVFIFDGSVTLPMQSQDMAERWTPFVREGFARAVGVPVSMVVIKAPRLQTTRRLQSSSLPLWVYDISVDSPAAREEFVRTLQALMNDPLDLRGQIQSAADDAGCLMCGNLQGTAALQFNTVARAAALRTEPVNSVYILIGLGAVVGLFLAGVMLCWCRARRQRRRAEAAAAKKKAEDEADMPPLPPEKPDEPIGKDGANKAKKPCCSCFSRKKKDKMEPVAVNVPKKDQRNIRRCTVEDLLTDDGKKHRLATQHLRYSKGNIVILGIDEDTGHWVAKFYHKLNVGEVVKVSFEGDAVGDIKPGVAYWVKAVDKLQFDVFWDQACTQYVENFEIVDGVFVVNYEEDWFKDVADEVERLAKILPGGEEGPPIQYHDPLGPGGGRGPIQDLVVEDGKQFFSPGPQFAEPVDDMEFRILAGLKEPFQLTDAVR